MKKTLLRAFIIFSVFALIVSCGDKQLELTDQSDIQTSLKNDKPKKEKKTRSDEFEDLSDGDDVPVSYIWVSNGDIDAKVSNSNPVSGSNNLKLQIRDDSAEADYIGTKFCLSSGATDSITVSFKIRFQEFVNWTGFGVVGGDDRMLYWWWVRADGTVFTDSTFDSFMVRNWHQVSLGVDKDTNTAFFNIDGNENVFDLDLDWVYTDPNEPMLCAFVFLGVYDVPQTVQIDGIDIEGY